MGSILIAMPKSDASNKIASLIRGSGLAFDINICETGSEVLRIVNDRDYGVIISTPRLCDMGYTEMAEMLPGNFGMIIITRDLSIELIRDNMVKLMMPFRAGDIIDTINMLTSGYMRRKKAKKNIPPPERSDEDRKLVDKAKALLMDRNGMSEQEAFRYMQKNSMDQGRKLVETAQMILTLYE